MAPQQLPAEHFLSKLQQRAAVLVGVALIVIGVWQFRDPPKRQTVEENSPEGTKKILEADADPQTLVIAVCVAGAVMVIYGLNGIRVLRISMKEWGVDSSASALSNANPRANERQTSQPLSPLALFSKVTPDEVVHAFLMRSSWNGLKVLKACALIQPKGKPFNLRTSPVVGPHSSFDYAYGYLIASMSAGAITGQADTNTGMVFVEWVHPVVVARIDEIVEGNIRVDPNLSEFKRGELAALVAFSGKL